VSRSIDEIRRRYAILRAQSGLPSQKFDTEAEKIARKLYRGPDHEDYREPVELVPENWFNAAHVIVGLMREDAPFWVCNKCGGTGIAPRGRTHEAEEGVISMCFACRGKGWQSEADRRRNEAYEEARRQKEDDAPRSRRRRW
jgi:hypothetical protein